MTGSDRRIRLFLLTIAVCSSAAGQSLYVDLSGDWRIGKSDDAVFAKPAFDDSAWGVFKLPRQATPPDGVYWLRRTVHVSAGADVDRAVITIGSVNEIYEVYVNGVLTGRLGSAVDPGPNLIARPRSFDVPAGVLHEGSNVTIALRIWRNPAIVHGTRHASITFQPDPGPYVLSSNVNAPRGAGATALRAQVFATTPNAIMASMQGLLGLILLLAWIAERKHLELLTLATLLISVAVLRTVEYVGVLFDRPLTFWAAGATLTEVASLALGLFVVETLAIPLRWLMWVTWLVSVAARVIFATGRPLLLPMHILLLLLIANSLWRVIRKTGRRANAILLHAVLALMVFCDAQRYAQSRVITVQYRWFGMWWHLFDISLIVLSVAATALLLQRLGGDRREKERLAAELSAARSLQQLMLEKPASTENYGIEAVYAPAQEVGGDFYWTRTDPDGALLVLTGDVSGKGLTAAMLVTLITGALRQRVERHPTDILALLNSAIGTDAARGFVTACCMRFEQNGSATVANAGHPAPYRNGCELDLQPGLPLGINADEKYHGYELTLADGDQMTFVSDGVVEATNTRGELFGFDRARDVSRKPAQEIAGAAKAWGQNDDITVLTVMRTA